MIDVAGFVAVERRVDDVVCIEAEQIHVQAQVVVDFFALVSDWDPDFFTHVFDHDVFWLEPNKNYSEKSNLTANKRRVRFCGSYSCTLPRLWAGPSMLDTSSLG